MKRFFTLFLSLSIFLSFSVSGFSQGKLIKSSEDKVPVWVKKDVKDIKGIKAFEGKGVVKFDSQSTTSMESAKLSAIADLKDYVVNSTLRYMVQFSVGDVDTEALKRDIENTSYVKGISEVTALATYWEVRFIKSSNTNLYKYYILFHFDDMEMRKIYLDVSKKNSSIMDEF